MRAAEAVEKAMHSSGPTPTVLNLDVLTLTNAIFRRLYATAYLDLVNKAPHLLGYFYDITDKPGPRDSRGDQAAAAGRASEHAAAGEAPDR